MQKRLSGLGPQQLDLGALSLRGHTFHYSSCETPHPVALRTAKPGAVQAVGAGEAVYEQGALRASYLHAWFPSNPEARRGSFFPEPLKGAHAL